MAIGASFDYIKQIKNNIIDTATTPDIHRMSRKSMPTESPVDTASISVQPPTPQLLECLNPETPSFDDDLSQVKQNCSNAELCGFLSVGPLSDLRADAKEWSNQKKMGL